MKLTLTNLGSESEAISSPRADWADAIEAGASFEVDGSEEEDVLIVGIKPTVLEQFEEAFQTLSKTVQALIAAIVGRKVQARDAGETEQVSMSIANHGANAVRVILGDGTTDVTVAPGTTQTCTAEGYLELRELGHAAGQGGTPD